MASRGAFRHIRFMNEWIMILLLSATSPAPPPCCHPAPAVLARANESEEERDYAGHFISPAVLTTSFYGTARWFGATRSQARWISVGTALGLVVAKELYDKSVADRFGLEETAIGMVGTGLGLWMAESVTWPEAKRAP